jgi:sulfate/thiosulfate transport system permease protein
MIYFKNLLVRWNLIIISIIFSSLFLIAPLFTVFYYAFEKGFGVFLETIQNEDTISAIKLTLIAAGISVPLNLIFGVVASWAIGKSFLISLINLPLSVSPVIAGLIFVLLFGIEGVFGELLSRYNIKILFAVPAIVLATIFITFPFIASELIPLMEELGKEEEEAAQILGANGFQIFWHVTLPNIKWGVLYGVIQCNARAIGEFGAVSVVSGHIRGLTNTMPLHVEILYNEYNFTGAFSVAALLASLSIITLVIKKIVQRKQEGLS